MNLILGKSHFAGAFYIMLSGFLTCLSLQGNCFSFAKRDTMECLEITGMVTINEKPQTDVTVQLWLENTQVATMDLKKEFKFKFILKKDAAYSIL